jgi:predicted N-acyltransferase
MEDETGRARGEFLMQPEQSVPFPGGVAKLVSQADLQEVDAWRTAFQAQCKDYRYYEILEDTLRDGFEHHYLVLEGDSGKVRAIQPLFFVRQNLTEGVTGGVRNLIDKIRKKFPRFLTMRVLMVGSAAGEGHLGCDPKDQAWAVGALHASLPAIARRHRASLIILKDFPAQYRSVLRTFATNGYARVPSMPYTRLRLSYSDFEDYLKTLGSATRKNLRRKFRKTAQAAPIEMEVVTDIRPYLDEIHSLYLQVHDRSPLKFETLTREYFRDMTVRMPDKTRFFLWRQNGRLIAFSFCLVHQGTLYDECLGLEYDVALDLHLYYYTIRDILSWSLEQGLKYYCSSPLNYDPKLHLGCHLMPLDLYVRHTAPLLNPIFGLAVKYLEPTRHDPVLKQFPNAHELQSDTA